MPLEFAGAARPLGATDIADLAAMLRIDEATIHAVRDIESAGSGFLPDKRPIILFESHVFHTETRGQFDGAHPGISTSSWVRNYGASGAHQYDRLAEAIALNRKAALRSASWGGFQIMGSNAGMCGYPDVEEFVRSMMSGEKEQLAAFGAFCGTSGALARLRTHDWAGFARIYNGPGYAANGYDTKLAQAWRKWSFKPDARPGNSAPRTEPSAFHATLQTGSRGPDVVELQANLGLEVDGVFGNLTRDAVSAFQRGHGLAADGIVGPRTRAALGLP